jgi:hypothetical protein
MALSKMHWVVLLTVFAAFWCGQEAAAQVRSITLGIRTHCPYGIRGCWPEIRDGLEAPSSIDVICGDPNAANDTCEVRMREDWLPDPAMFQQNFTEMRIGVDVRGVEAVVEGRLAPDGTNFVLHVGGRELVMRLAPLKQKVQWDKQRQQPEPATPAEQNAFRALIDQSSRIAGPIRVVGPLRNVSTGSGPLRQVLEVRQFELLKESSPKKS